MVMLWMLLTDRFPPACSEGVPDVTLNTRAGGNVVHDTAHGIDTACAGAGVHTVEPLACSVRRAVGVDHTLRSACHVGVPKVFRDAAA
jgi:hypothetical protein